MLEGMIVDKAAMDLTKVQLQQHFLKQDKY